MANLYSERFIKNSGIGASTTWQIPAGKRAIVKTCSGLNSAGTAGTAYASIEGCIFWYGSSAGGSAFPTFNGMAVAYPLEHLTLVTTGSVVSAQISGYLLDTV